MITNVDLSKIEIDDILVFNWADPELVRDIQYVDGKYVINGFTYFKNGRQTFGESLWLRSCGMDDFRIIHIEYVLKFCKRYTLLYLRSLPLPLLYAAIKHWQLDKSDKICSLETRTLGPDIKWL